MGPRMLQSLLGAAVEDSFNRITVDGDTSTNDTVVGLASGRAEVPVIPGNSSRAWFLEGITLVCQTLARMIARDGEGATRLVTVEVRGARTPRDAERAARSIANSPLVKTALAGADPNWGRIICAAGYSGASFDPNKVDILVNDLCLCRKGVDAGFDEAAAHQELDRKELTLRVDLHAGRASTRVWTCDFTQDYITINASYRT
jgi:glutamate N-acetyltransferase/amino-acid N-acetyltransferase